LGTEAKFNETSHLLMKSQDELLNQGDKLMIAEHKVARPAGTADLNNF
jgi:hypothetical protein